MLTLQPVVFCPFQDQAEDRGKVRGLTEQIARMHQALTILASEGVTNVKGFDQGLAQARAEAGVMQCEISVNITLPPLCDLCSSKNFSLRQIPRLYYISACHAPTKHQSYEWPASFGSEETDFESENARLSLILNLEPLTLSHKQSTINPVHTCRYDDARLSFILNPKP